MKALFSLIKNAIDIVEVINQYVRLEPIGNYFKGLSPFKNEKTPSFTVTPDKKIFYCFSTHIGGDVIDFISRIENCSQYQAACLLIERYHLKIDKKYTIHAKQKTEEENFYFKIYAIFVQFTQKKLKYNKQAHEYLLSRGINDESINHFSIGFCPGIESIKEFISLVNQESILLVDILKTHLIQETKTKKLFFTADNRIIFPITNVLHLYCGYGGRTYFPTDERPKYINSVNTPEFLKKNILYGFCQAKETMQTKKEVYFVEGFLDCIAMHQAGYKNTVATMGTAATKQHIELVKKFVERIIIVYDADTAGKNALLRFIGLCWDQEIDVDIILLPLTEDPASVAQKGTIHEAMQKKLSAISFFVTEKKNSIQSISLKETNNGLKDILDAINSITDEKKKVALLLKVSQEIDIPMTFLEKLLFTKENTKKELPIFEIKSIKKNNVTEEQEKRSWYLFFYLTLYFYDPKTEITKKSIFLFRHFAVSNFSIIISAFEQQYHNNKDFLAFLKEYNEKLYGHCLQFISIYHFSQAQYTVIFNKIFQSCWKLAKNKDRSLTVNNFFTNSKNIT